MTLFFCGAIIKKNMERNALQGLSARLRPEYLEVNAEQWTRIIVEVEPPARWIGQQKQLRSPLKFAFFAELCGRVPF